MGYDCYSCSAHNKCDSCQSGKVVSEDGGSCLTCFEAGLSNECLSCSSHNNCIACTSGKVPASNRASCEKSVEHTCKYFQKYEKDSNSCALNLTKMGIVGGGPILIILMMISCCMIKENMKKARNKLALKEKDQKKKMKQLE